MIDSLKITPHVFADGYIGLETNVVIGSKSTPEGVKQIPIVTKREITNKENRIRSGESLVIGGIRKTEKRSVVRGVPFLKDLPGIGVLFSSKDFEERGKEVLFIITPTISTGGIPREEMTSKIRNIHTKVRYERGLRDLMFDPFGRSGNNGNNRDNGEDEYDSPGGGVAAPLENTGGTGDAAGAGNKTGRGVVGGSLGTNRQDGTIKTELEEMLKSLEGN